MSAQGSPMSACLRSTADDHAGAAWIVIAAGVAAAMHVAKLPPALPVLERELGLGLVQAGFLLSLVSARDHSQLSLRK